MSVCTYVCMYIRNINNRHHSIQLYKCTHSEEGRSRFLQNFVTNKDHYTWKNSEDGPYLSTETPLQAQTI